MRTTTSFLRRLSPFLGSFIKTLAEQRQSGRSLFCPVAMAPTTHYAPHVGPYYTLILQLLLGVIVTCVNKCCRCD